MEAITMPVAKQSSPSNLGPGTGPDVGGHDFITLSTPKKQCVALIYGEVKTEKTLTRR
jgi:hypothetical protein